MAALQDMLEKSSPLPLEPICVPVNFSELKFQGEDIAADELDVLLESDQALTIIDGGVLLLALLGLGTEGVSLHRALLFDLFEQPMNLLVLLLDGVLEQRGLAGVGALQVGHLLFDHPELLLPAVHLLLLHLPAHCLHPPQEEAPQLPLDRILLEPGNHRNWLCHWLFLKVVVAVQRALQLIERALLLSEGRGGQVVAGLGKRRNTNERRLCNFFRGSQLISVLCLVFCILLSCDLQCICGGMSYQLVKGQWTIARIQSFKQSMRRSFRSRQPMRNSPTSIIILIKYQFNSVYYISYLTSVSFPMFHGLEGLRSMRQTHPRTLEVAWEREESVTQMFGALMDTDMFRRGGRGGQKQIRMIQNQSIICSVAW